MYFKEGFDILGNMLSCSELDEKINKIINKFHLKITKPEPEALSYKTESLTHSPFVLRSCSRIPIVFL